MWKVHKETPIYTYAHIKYMQLNRIHTSLYWDTCMSTGVCICVWQREKAVMLGNWRTGLSLLTCRRPGMKCIPVSQLCAGIDRLLSCRSDRPDWKTDHPDRYPLPSESFSPAPWLHSSTLIHTHLCTNTHIFTIDNVRGAVIGHYNDVMDHLHKSVS